MLRSFLSDPFFTQVLGVPSSSGGVVMDWKETEEAHVFKMDLPGVAKEEVKLQVHEGGVIHVSADRKDDEGEEYGKVMKWHCRERSGGEGGSLKREFRVPGDADVEGITAAMNDGVLVITVPKKKTGKEGVKRWTVEIEGGEEEEDRKVGKGLGRFVCCKA